MVLGKNCESDMDHVAEELQSEFGLVRYKRLMSGKRISIPSNMKVGSTEIKKLRTKKIVHIHERSLLEALPEDILIRVLYSVRHDDLKQLFHVSNQVRKATLIAKQCYFAYRTPQKIPAFRNPMEEAKTPNAPKQPRYRTQLSGRKLAVIPMPLFEEESCSRKKMEI